MDIIRNDDGTLVVPITPARRHDGDDEVEDGTGVVEAAATTRVLHPGEGGYDEALTAWDLQQDPERAPSVSTASGREEAMTVVHAVASTDASAADAVDTLQDPAASGEALRHVLVGGVHAVEDFAAEVADAEGGEPLPAHQATKIIGEVLAELD